MANPVGGPCGIPVGTRPRAVPTVLVAGIRPREMPTYPNFPAP
jgi:hypothetical protein